MEKARRACKKSHAMQHLPRLTIANIHHLAPVCPLALSGFAHCIVASIKTPH
jgi:hypothetical protein